MRNFSTAIGFLALFSTPVAFAAAPAGDAVQGKAFYEAECKGCHGVNETVVGPKHCGVVGRKVGSVEGYAYSGVMKDAGFHWDATHLDEFLTAPISYLSGTNMGYAGVDNPQDRANVIAFLQKEMDPKVCATASAAP